MLRFRIRLQIMRTFLQILRRRQKKQNVFRKSRQQPQLLQLLRRQNGEGRCAPDKKMPWILFRMHGRVAMKQDGPYGSFFRARSLVYRARVALSTASTITPTSAKMAVHMLAMPTAPSTRQANLMASANTMF